MTRYLFSAHMSPRAVECEQASGPRRSVQEVMDLVDTSDPAWPGVAVVLQEFTAAGIELDVTSVPLAVRLGRQRWAAESQATTDGGQQTLTATSGSFVYYILRGDLIKIGTTTSPGRRFYSLMPDAILAVEPGGRREESQRHRQFMHLRRGGEFFTDTPELRDHIDKVRSLHGDPDPSWFTTSQLDEPSRGWRPTLVTSTATMTACEAVTNLGINESTLRGWAHRGRLYPVGTDHLRRQLYYVQHLVALRDSAPMRRAQQTVFDKT